MDRRDDNPWTRKRRQQEEEDEEQERIEEILSGRVQNLKPGQLDASTEKLMEYLKRADPMIEQINNLYNQYLTGAEKRPPTERRKQLDQLMATIMIMGKPTKSLQFRCNSLHYYYATYRDRWDRLMRDLESGKIKRRGGS
jgi:hypothetical protein